MNTKKLSRAEARRAAAVLREIASDSETLSEYADALAEYAQEGEPHREAAEAVLVNIRDLVVGLVSDVPVVQAGERGDGLLPLPWMRGKKHGTWGQGPTPEA